MNLPWEPKMLIGMLYHTSVDFGIHGFGSTLGFLILIGPMRTLKAGTLGLASEN